MTHFIAAYDTERRRGAEDHCPPCVEACRPIVAMHKRHQMPATFFIVGRVLEQSAEEFKRLLDDPLFEIASHTWSHRMLKDNPFCGRAIRLEQARVEIVRGRQAVEKHFPDRPCLGLRPGCSFVDGLHNAPELLQMIVDAGFRYTSSQAWGPDFTLPAPLTQRYTYADEGHGELIEFPCHGWHDNVLKIMSGPGRWSEPRRLIAFPPTFPEAIPPGPIREPEEEFRFNCKVIIDRATRDALEYVTPIWHPWSLAAFDPEMRMLDMTFRYVREKGLTATTFARLYEQVSSMSAVT